MIINDEGYLQRCERAYGNSRDWFFVKYRSNISGIIHIKNLVLDKKYIGKRIKLKIYVEEVKE